MDSFSVLSVEIVNPSVETSVTTIAAPTVEAAARLIPPIEPPIWRLEFNKVEWVAFIAFASIGALNCPDSSKLVRFVNW
jgi:hypothetical protein